MEYYRCFTVYNPKIRSTAIANTFYWLEYDHFQSPKITLVE